MSQNTTKTGFWVGLTTSVHLNEKNINILKELQDYFGGIGRIYHQANINEALFTVNSIKEIETIISHFYKYPLKTNKSIDFTLLKQAHLLIKEKKHLTTEGILKLANIKASMNAKKDIVDISGIVPVDLPVLPETVDIDPNWIAGFTSGEGCFTVNIKNRRVV